MIQKKPWVECRSKQLNHVACLGLRCTGTGFLAEILFNRNVTSKVEKFVEKISQKNDR